jgi:hypothetical protein
MAPPLLLSVLALASGGVALRRLLRAKVTDSQNVSGTPGSSASEQPQTTGDGDRLEKEVLEKLKKQLENRIDGWEKLGTDLEQFPYYLRYVTLRDQICQSSSSHALSG